MQPELPETPPAQDVHGVAAIPIIKAPLKIGGLLILIAVGLIFSLIQNLGHFLENLALFRKDQVWERLTTPGSIAYHPYWKPVLFVRTG
jgi:hypothetical protein